MKGPAAVPSSSSVVVNTPIIDDKGRVVGTEPRTFTLLHMGRHLTVVEDDGASAPTEEDRRDLASFVGLAQSGRHAEAARVLGRRTGADIARLRQQYHREGHGVALIDLVKQLFAGRHTALGNVVCALLYPAAEFCADEIHLATMGLSDNHGAMVDCLCSASAPSPAQVSFYYGIKFGDGRYEVKSADGRGDVEKLQKDVRFASRGKQQQLLLARVAGGGAAPKGSIDSAWEEGLADFLASATAEELGTAREKHGGAATLASKLGGGDAALVKTVLARISDPVDYWVGRLGEALQQRNRKVVLRAIALTTPAQRSAIGKHFDAAKLALLGDDDDGNFIRDLLQ